MERRFFVRYLRFALIVNEDETKRLFNVALMNNKDITSLYVLEINERLNEDEGRLIANAFDLSYEYNKAIESGETPFGALREWDLI